MFEEYPKQVILKDGQEVVFRLLRTTDFQALMDFFGRIPEEERWYAKHDLADERLVREWVDHIDLERAVPVVAEVEERLVAG